MSKPYSHRHGESEPPTEQGEYWFSGTRGDSEYKWRVELSACDSLGRKWRVSDLDMGYWGDSNPLDIYQGQWWGPIPDDVPPWEQP